MHAIYLTYVTQVVPVVTYYPKELIFSRQHSITHSSLSFIWFLVWIFVCELILIPHVDLSMHNVKVATSDNRKPPGFKSDNSHSPKGTKAASQSTAVGATERLSRFKDKRSSENPSSPRNPAIQPSASTGIDIAIHSIFSYLGYKRLLEDPDFIQVVACVCLAALHLINAFDSICAVRHNVRISISHSSRS